MTQKILEYARAWHTYTKAQERLRDLDDRFDNLSGLDVLREYHDHTKNFDVIAAEYAEWRNAGDRLESLSNRCAELARQLLDNRFEPATILVDQSVYHFYPSGCMGWIVCDQKKIDGIAP